MNREIKIRVWDKYHRCFLKEGGGYLKDIDHVFVSHFTPRSVYEVSQSTGLKDINGFDIYEGDIVLAKGYPFYGIAPGIVGFEGECKELDYVGEVYFSEHDLSYCYKMRVVSDRVAGRACGGHLSDLTDKCEVIGNIYENPELLEIQQ